MNLDEEKKREKSVFLRYFKIYQLKEQMGALEKLKGTPIFAISAFVFKSQLIEFELKRIIQVLDMEININLVKSINGLKRIIRSPEYFNDKTLGRVISIVNEYEGLVNHDFKKKLKELNDLRNDFTHHLFSNEKKLDELVKDSERGLIIGDNILKEIELINDKILGPFMNKIENKDAK